MTAFVLQPTPTGKCCGDEYFSSTPICPEGPCEECDDCESGCVAPSTSSTEIYEIVSSTKDSEDNCEYTLQPLNYITGAYEGSTKTVDEDQFKNYVKVDCPANDCECGWEDCWSPNNDPQTSYIAAWCGKPKNYPNAGESEIYNYVTNYFNHNQKENTKLLKQEQIIL